MATQGWKWLFNSKREHYFVEGRSLCKKWMTLGNGGFDTTIDKPKCKTCEKALAKAKEKELLKSASFDVLLARGDANG